MTFKTEFRLVADISAFNATDWVRNETEMYTSTNLIERYIHIPFQAHKWYANFHFLGVNSQVAWLDANHELHFAQRLNNKAIRHK